MTCSDADRLWDDILDARAAGDPAGERRIASHAATCPRCRVVAERYRTLRAAIATLPPPPGPSENLERRFLEACRAARPRPASPRRKPIPWVALAAAASLVAAAWIGTRSPAVRPRPRSPEVRIHLASALADATSATIDLARGVTAPAARIGLDMLDLDGEDFATAASGPGDDETAAPTSDFLRSVGERIDAGARPLSGSARNAFDFLLRPGAEAGRSPALEDDGV